MQRLHTPPREEGYRAYSILRWMLIIDSPKYLWDTQPKAVTRLRWPSSVIFNAAPGFKTQWGGNFVLYLYCSVSWYVIRRLFYWYLLYNRLIITLIKRSWSRIGHSKNCTPVFSTRLCISLNQIGTSYDKNVHLVFDCRSSSNRNRDNSHAL